MDLWRWSAGHSAWQGVMWWAVSAAVSGFGMAMLYPNLSAAVMTDISHPAWRGSSIGIYRFWLIWDTGLVLWDWDWPPISLASWRQHSGLWLCQCSPPALC
ncbi:MAG: hypothetical protein U5M53_12485 [Rhodoferax sp.]|nr:hypothetical protein [Rhodoferax sp.]